MDNKRLIIIDKLGIIYDNSFFEEHIKYVNYYIEKNKINNYFKLDVGFQKARILSSLGYVVILGTGDNYLIYFRDSISLIQAKEFIKILESLKDKNIFYTLYKNNFSYEIHDDSEPIYTTSNDRVKEIKDIIYNIYPSIKVSLYKRIRDSLLNSNENFHIKKKIFK